MIQDTKKVRVDQTKRSRRIDNPSLVLPSPHFDATNQNKIFEFLTTASRRLQDRNTTCDNVEQTIRQIYGVLHGMRSNCGHVEWRAFVDRCRQHEIISILHQDEFTRRAYVKPRGYAGDAPLLDYMYATEHYWHTPDMSWVGQRIHRWTTLCSACQGVKARRAIIADHLDQLANEKSNAKVLSLAAGHFREAEISSAVIRQQFDRLVTVDSDSESLQQIDRDYGRFGVETIHASARELVTGRIDVGSFDLIYSSGLCDYLNESICQKLTDKLFDRLNPNGKLLLTNFVEDIEAVGYMEVFMDWNLIYRNRTQMMAMAARIPDRMIKRVTCFSEDNHNVLFLLIEKV